MLLTVVVTGHNCVAARQWTAMQRNMLNLCCMSYDDAVCVTVNTAVEINVLDYNVTVHQCMAPCAV